MRLAVVMGSSTGGVGQHVRSVVTRLPACDIGVDVYGPRDADELFGFSVLGAGFSPVDIGVVPRPLPDVRAIRTLRRQLVDADHRYDVVHAHGLRAAALTGLALGRRRPSRVPLVATWHNAVLARGWRRYLLAALERIAATRADLTLGASADLVDRARDMGAAQAVLAPVAAPTMLPASRTPTAVRAELGCGDRPLIIAIGRLAPQKRYDVLLAAAHHWRNRNPQPLVAIAGDGPLRGELQAAARTHDLPVLFLGRRSDVPDLLSAADIAVLTSDWEARALVAQEALRAGVPLVATAVGGVPELVDGAAVLVPPGDPAAVARAVTALLDDPGRRSVLAKQGLARAASWPNEDEVVVALVSHYRRLADAA
jgi:glycosyltransferase involved in cell wall biosynthesis